MKKILLFSFLLFSSLLSLADTSDKDTKRFTRDNKDRTGFPHSPQQFDIYCIRDVDYLLIYSQSPICGSITIENIIDEIVIYETSGYLGEEVYYPISSDGIYTITLIIDGISYTCTI